MMERTEKRIWTTGLTLLAMIVAVMILATFAPGCANAYRAGWASTAALVDATAATDKGIAVAFKSKVTDCVSKHPKDVPATRACVEASTEYKAARQWQTSVLPSVNTAIKVAIATLEIAERVQASKESTLTKVLNALKDGVCKLLPVLDEWKDRMSANMKAAMVYVKMIGVVCP